MLGKRMWRVATMLALVALIVAACGGGATQAPSAMWTPAATEALAVT